MAVTQTDLDSIDAALASGELRVQVGDQEVTYRSSWELLSVRNSVAQLLQSQTAGALTPRYRVASFND